MNSILNERSFDIMTSVAGDGYIESKNEYSFGLENNSILGSIMKWRSKEYAAADKLSAVSADTKENSKSFAVLDHAHSIDPFRQKVAGLGRATSLLDESNNSDIFVRSRENSYRSAAPTSTTIPSFTTLHISKPTASPVVNVPSHTVSAHAEQHQQLRKPVVVQAAALPPPPTTTTNVAVPTQPNATIDPVVDKEQLDAFFSTIPMSFLNPPRLGKKLLVLDLDHTLLDFTRKEALDLHRMKRPFMDEFLAAVYPYYDLALWSQTHWKYIDIKVTQLGIIPNPRYKVCLILDKTSMYNVSADKTISNKVKPLQLIWSRYPNLWSSCNTVHVDDIEKNFLLNKSSGILITPFNRSPLPLFQEQQLLASSSSDSADSNATGCSRSDSADPAAAPSVAVESTQQVQCGVVSGCGSAMWKQSNAHRAVAGPSQAAVAAPAAAVIAASPCPDAPLQTPCGLPDRELAILSRYLVKLAAYPDVSSFDHSQWNRKRASV